MLTLSRFCAALWHKLPRTGRGGVGFDQVREVTPGNRTRGEPGRRRSFTQAKTASPGVARVVVVVGKARRCVINGALAARRLRGN
jgi:hypothetical protein